MPRAGREIVFNRALGSFFATTVSFVIPYLRMSPFRGYKIGDASMLIAERLVRTCGAYLSLFRRLRLVNVKSWYTGFSYGTFDPKQSPAIRHLTFTFQISELGNADLYGPIRVRILSNRVIIWGTDSNPAQFVCVGFDSKDLTAFNISNLQTRSLKYLYMSCGVVLRSVFRRRGRVDVDIDAFKSQHSRLASNVVSQKPLVNLFNLPYEMWAMQRSVWNMCPNLIAQRCLNPYSAPFILDFALNSSIDFRSSAYDLIWDDENESGDTLFSLMRKSMLRFIAAVNDQDTSLPDQSGLLFPSLLYSILFEGDVGFSDNASEVYPNMVTSFNERELDLAELFEPYDLTLRRMMRGDAATVSRLVKAIDIFES